MFLKHKRNGTLLEVLNVGDLFDPCRKEVIGQLHAGEEMQDPSTFMKSELIFPSGETLPRCWLAPDYHVAVSHIAASPISHISDA